MVNEPINSKPLYIDAIGGKGDTGWDWVIWSFEQARIHFPKSRLTTATMLTVLDMLAETGLPIYISELDITGDDATQLARYKEKFPILYEYSLVKGIMLWEWIKGQTWQAGTELITKDGEERPALTWLRKYLSQVETTLTVTAATTPTPTELKLSGDANYDNVINMLDVIVIAGNFNDQLIFIKKKT
ncbi:endo-1,4-beta-xylanase [Pseudobacteroides cellulosolvens]|uniref:Glycoside hydrolase family 10 n=1 Tax=Pseudobacteroides cellulosolvens ATCC 35603 = DSM 2933 TaxID=398512 RepID=A0A0L6JGF0_9FIRM|nr:endo-1,4-beta-xylanase [Pseudobacteroides cellulosolvens]KNY24765.1 glycoside hydrolase family 10 [Pseudobacteroides cellulosolvens ATCC 35603 = DSM 2933]